MKKYSLFLLILSLILTMNLMAEEGSGHEFSPLFQTSLENSINNMNKSEDAIEIKEVKHGLYAAATSSIITCMVSTCESQATCGTTCTETCESTCASTCASTCQSTCASTCTGATCTGATCATACVKGDVAREGNYGYDWGSYYARMVYLKNTLGQQVRSTSFYWTGYYEMQSMYQPGFLVAQAKIGSEPYVHTYQGSSSKPYQGNGFIVININCTEQ